MDLERTANSERLLQLCGDLGLFLCSTNFRNNKRHLATWRSPATGQPSTQIDHIAISYRWRGSVTDCKSIWSTSVDSDHALVRCRFSLLFPGKKTLRKPRITVERLNDPEVKLEYQLRLERNLPMEPPQSLDEHWKTLSEVITDSGKAACGSSTRSFNRHWISKETLALLDSRKNIPDGPQYKIMRRKLNGQLKKSIRRHREVWWTQKAEEMEAAQNSGNARKLFQLVRATGPRKATVSETIKNKRGSLIHSKEDRMDRWAEHFSEQFNWPPAARLDAVPSEQEAWNVNLEAPSISEVK